MEIDKWGVEVRAWPGQIQGAVGDGQATLLAWARKYSPSVYRKAVYRLGNICWFLFAGIMLLSSMFLSAREDVLNGQLRLEAQQLETAARESACGTSGIGSCMLLSPG